MPLSKARDRERKRLERTTKSDRLAVRIAEKYMSNVQPISNLNHVQPVQPKIAELQKMIRDIETKAIAPQSGSIPIYDSRLHKVGDTVKKWNGVRYVVCTVPEIDGDGHEIW